MEVEGPASLTAGVGGTRRSSEGMSVPVVGEGPWGLSGWRRGAWDEAGGREQGWQLPGGALSSAGRRGAGARIGHPHLPARAAAGAGGRGGGHQSEALAEACGGLGTCPPQCLGAQGRGPGWAAGTRCHALSGQALPAVTIASNGSLSPRMWSLLDLKEGSLTQPSVLVFSRNSWYRLSMSGDQPALGSA